MNKHTVVPCVAVSAKCSNLGDQMSVCKVEPTLLIPCSGSLSDKLSVPFLFVYLVYDNVSRERGKARARAFVSVDGLCSRLQSIDPFLSLAVCLPSV